MVGYRQKNIKIDISGMSDNFGNKELGGIDICGGGHIFTSTLGMMTFDMCSNELPKLDISSQGIDVCGNNCITNITSNNIKISNPVENRYIDISSNGIDINWSGRIVIQM